MSDYLEYVKETIFDIFVDFNEVDKFEKYIIASKILCFLEPMCILERDSSMAFIVIYDECDEYEIGDVLGLIPTIYMETGVYMSMVHTDNGILCKHEVIELDDKMTFCNKERMRKIKDIFNEEDNSI